MVEEIKCCPFCGSDPEVEDITNPASNKEIARISCYSDECPGFVDSWWSNETPLQSAITSWNRRVDLK